MDYKQLLLIIGRLAFIQKSRVLLPSLVHGIRTRGAFKVSTVNGISRKPESKLKENTGLQRKKRAECASCSYAYYCNRDCRNKHVTHREECLCLRKFAEANRIPDQIIRLVAQAMWKLKDPSSHEIFCTVGDENYCYRDLPMHPDFQLTDSSDPATESLLNDQHEQFHSFVNERCLSFKEFSTLYGKVTKHMLPISEGRTEAIGLGMYLGMAAVQHSCRPNANISFIGTTAQIIACSDFEVKVPHTVTVRRVYTMAPRRVRQASLKSCTGETCSCEMCQSEEFEKALSDVESGEGASSVMNSVMNTLRDLDQNRDNYGQEDLKNTACNALTSMNGIAGKFNYLRGRMLEIAVTSCMKLKQYEEAISNGKQLLCIYRYVLGPNTVMEMNVLKNLGESYKEIGNPQKARDYFAEHLQVAYNIYGSAHPFFQSTRYDVFRMEERNWENH